MQIIKGNGNKYILPVPDRLKGRLHIDNYLLIQPTVDGSDYGAEIVRVIDGAYMRFYAANRVWPKQFEDLNLGELGEPTKKKKTKDKTKIKPKKIPKKKTDEELELEAQREAEKQTLVATTAQTKKKPKKKPLPFMRSAKERETSETVESDTSTELETETDDDEVTIKQKRINRLKKVGNDIQTNIDNTIITPAVITKREAFVKAKDDMPPLSGFVQPWAAVLQRKRMTEKQIQQNIQKEMHEKLERTKQQTRTGLVTANHKLPCDAVPGQIMVPWEDIVGKYKDAKPEDFDDSDECDGVTEQFMVSGEDIVGNNTKGDLDETEK